MPIVQRNDAGMDLRNIAQLYAADALAWMPPKKIEDLKGLDAETRKALNAGIYVVLWGASPNAPGTAIVAYEKDVPKKGGMVANFTGTVSQMTPAEFKATPEGFGKLRQRRKGPRASAWLPSTSTISRSTSAMKS